MFDYEVDYTDAHPVRILDRIQIKALEGWEIVSVVIAPDIKNEAWLFFKRKKKDS